MLEKIKNTFDTELNQKKNSTYERIAAYVLERCRENPTTMEAVAAAVEEKKNIAGAVEEMKKEAKKTAINGIGCLSDEEGYSIIMKYFGVEAGQEAVSLLDLL